MSKKLYIETYGCQMNVVDSEIVVSILKDEGFDITQQISDADIILVNTCSIRENAEQKIRNRLKLFKSYKNKKKDLIIGVIGCMAERLKTNLFEEEKAVDLIIGPDAYRELPKVIKLAGNGQKSANVILSEEEMYADINPLRYDSNGVSAFISIMRGCNNMCAYCVVPYTRGTERSRNPHTIINEINNLKNSGYKEITLLGQNVNSYLYNIDNKKFTFPDLLSLVAESFPEIRIRYSTSHPKDLSVELLNTMARYPNICRHIHLPVQSGSSRILDMMKRGYTRDKYLKVIENIKSIIPDCAISTDIISGFCSETEFDHQQTLSLMEEVGFDFAFMFKYSERPDTFAASKYKDDIDDETKTRRLNEIINLQNKLSFNSKKQDIGKIYEVLIEGFSKKSKAEVFGRTSQNKVVVFPADNHKIGDMVKIQVTSCTSATLIGKKID
jgi:tRNA-2-methylthio-N6-dimethylallyladenosine synthase